MEQNIIKYNLFQVFAKRVYLPLIAIYLVSVGGISLSELGVIASITAMVQLVMEVPTGYFADRFGHKNSIMLGSFLSSLSPLIYIISPNFVGGLLASVIFFGGGSFTRGAIQAFIHDTLMELGRDKEYAKAMGRAQSYGLIGNVILIALVPLTFQIDNRLPFAIGFVASFIAFLLAYGFTAPRKEKVSVEKQEHTLFYMLQRLPKLNLLVLFVMVGIVSAVFDQAAVFRELVFKDVGIPVVYFGFILSAGSLIAAVVGRYIHHLADIKPAAFYLFDILFLVMVLVLIGFTRNPYFIVSAFLLLPAYDRNRGIVIESHLLKQYAKEKYKATLISTLNFFGIGNGIWVPIALAAFMEASGLNSGYLVFGLALLVPLLMLYFLVQVLDKRNRQSDITT